MRDVFDEKPNDRGKNKGFEGGVGCKKILSTALVSQKKVEA